MHGAACAAMSIVGIANSLERNVGVDVRLVAFRIERQIVKAMLPDVVQRHTPLLLGRADAPCCLYMLSSQFPQLAEERTGEQQNQQECQRSFQHSFLSVSFRR